MSHRHWFHFLLWPRTSTARFEDCNINVHAQTSPSCMQQREKDPAAEIFYTWSHSLYVYVLFLVHFHFGVIPVALISCKDCNLHCRELQSLKEQPVPKVAASHSFLFHSAELNFKNGSSEGRLGRTQDIVWVRSKVQIIPKNNCIMKDVLALEKVCVVVVYALIKCSTRRYFSAGNVGSHLTTIGTRK